MKMAKASNADIEVAMELCTALNSLNCSWPSLPRSMPGADDEDDHPFDRDDPAQCVQVLGYLLDLTERASLFRVVFGLAVMLDPRNMCVDPDADTIEHHPFTIIGMDAKTARPLDKWHEDMGEALWWKFPLEEAPYCGSPLCDDWPGYHTHFTPLIPPISPADDLEPDIERECCGTPHSSSQGAIA